MEMSIFLSLAFTEILHLNNYTFLNHQCGNVCFLINYIEFQAPQICSSPQQWRSQDVFIGVAREGPATSLGWHSNLHYFNIKMWLTIKVDYKRLF